MSRPHAEVVTGASPRDVPAERRLIELMNEFERPIYAFLLRLVGDADVAADCLQDTFIRAYELLRKQRPVTRQWLYRVARNRAVDEYRRRRRDEDKARSLLPLQCADSDDVAVGEGIERAFQQLSWEEREVLYLWAVDGFSGKEIGELIGINAGAVHMRVSRARSRFREAYGRET